MSNKYWKEILNGWGEKLYILYFKSFYDEEELLRFTKDENNDYVYMSKLLNVENDYLDCEKEDSIDNVEKLYEEFKSAVDDYIEFKKG